MAEQPVQITYEALPDDVREELLNTITDFIDVELHKLNVGHTAIVLIVGGATGGSLMGNILPIDQLELLETVAANLQATIVESN